MRLDQTYVKVRERNVLELVDLTFVLLRRKGWTVLWLLLIGCWPFLILNAFLLAPVAWYQVDYNTSPAGQIFQHLMLVFLEAPLATVFVTAFLGQAVFEYRPSLNSVVRSAISQSGRLIGVIGFARLNIIFFPIMVMMVMGGVFSSDYGSWWLGFLCMSFLGFLAWLLRALAPFTPEVILLEKPSGLTSTGVGVFGMRVKQLHHFSGGEIFLRALVSTFFSALLFFSLYGGIWLMWAYFINEWYPGVGVNVIGLPIAAWGTVLFNVVFRFLSYLDIRIRQEGWEVELLMKAEARALSDAATWSRPGKGASS